MSNATRILIALAAGLLLGIAATSLSPGLANNAANIADPVGNLWLNGLRMTIVPLVVALLVTGIAQTAEAARAGLVASRSLMWITGVMATSAVMGAILTPFFLSIVPMPAESADALKAALGSASKVETVPPFGDFLRALVPTNPIAAAANDAILPLMIFTTIFAFACTKLPLERRNVLTDFFAALADAMIVVIEWVLKLAPIGVFALAFVVGARAGTGAFGALLHYIATVSAVGIVISLLAYPLAVFGARLPLGIFTRAIAPAAVINCRPVGVLVMEDDGGGDEKIIAVPSTKLTRRYEKIQNYFDLPEITIKQIEHFFAHYKDLEPGKWVKIKSWGSAEEAQRLISEAVERFKAKKA